MRRILWLIGWAVLASSEVARTADAAADKRPNVLFAITDDQSWIHAGVYGTRGIRTPAFDRIARGGVRFDFAFAAAPSCTPSRSAILTGQAIWRLGEGGQLFGTLPARFPVFPKLLEQAGYFVGHTGKTWSPGNLTAGGRSEHPVGRAYAKKKLNIPLPGMSRLDYEANFREFLADRPQGKPFFFWFGSSEPHRRYRSGQGLAAGKLVKGARLFASLPDLPEVREDVLDYYVEIEHFDAHLAKMIAAIEEAGELDNTVIIATSDHGMPFPRAKATLYDSGTRVPLAVRYPPRVAGRRVVDDMVSLTDIAPTILELAGLKVPDEMTGRSLVPILTSVKSGRVEPRRDRVFTAFERHTWCRPGGVGYPMRAIRTHKYLYIRNYHPERWPMGDDDFVSPHQGNYGDIDLSPTKLLMIKRRNDPSVAPLFELAFGKRPSEELYDLTKDPEQMHNIAGDAKYNASKQELAGQLDAHLRETGDPRSAGKAPWDGYPYYFQDYWKRAKQQ